MAKNWTTEKVRNTLDNSFLVLNAYKSLGHSCIMRPVGEDPLLTMVSAHDDDWGYARRALKWFNGLKIRKIGSEAVSVDADQLEYFDLAEIWTDARAVPEVLRTIAGYLNSVDEPEPHPEFGRWELSRWPRDPKFRIYRALSDCEQELFELEYGLGEIDEERVELIKHHILVIHDLVDGNPLGTEKRRREELAANRPDIFEAATAALNARGEER